MQVSEVCMNEVWHARSGIVARGRGVAEPGPGGEDLAASAWQRLEALPDPRSPRGRIYPLACLAAIAVCAFTAAGNDRFTAVGQGVRRAGQADLARLRAPQDPLAGRYQVPDEKTIRVVLDRLDPRALARALLGGRPDSCRDMRHRRDHHLARQPAAETSQSVALLVKRNPPLLHAQVRALPWRQVPAGASARHTGHGRAETRTLKTAHVSHRSSPAPAIKITRWRQETGTGKTSRQTVYAVTSLTSAHATAQDLGRLVREHWSIEAHHHVRS